METYKLPINIITDEISCIILPNTMQKHEFLKEKLNIFISFGQQMIKAPIFYHNGINVILSNKLADKLYFPYKNISLHIIMTESIIKIGPLVAIYAREKQEGNFGIINNLLKDFAVQSEKNGLALMVFTPNNSDFQKQVIDGYKYNTKEEYSWQKHHFPFPDIIMDRGVFGTTKEWNSAHKERAKYQEQTNILKFNAPLGNKYELHSILKKNPLVCKFIPDTELLYNDNDFIKMIYKHPTAYIKPINGTQGKGIYKVIKNNNQIRLISNHHQYVCKSMKYAKKIIHQHINITNRKKRYLIQQEIQLYTIHNSLVDFRVLLQKKENLRWGVSAIIARIGKSNNITSNLSNGGTVKDGAAILKKIAASSGNSYEYLMQQIKDISILAAYTIETEYGAFGELGIDIGVDKKGKPWIIEINPRPGRKSLRLISETLRLKSLRIPILYCLKLWLKENRGNLK